MTIFLILFLGIVVVFCIALSKLPDQDPSLLYQTKIFGEYTRKIKWDDNYILYNEKTRRILLYDGHTPEDLNEIIYDTGVIKKLDITENFLATLTIPVEPSSSRIDSKRRFTEV